MVHAPKSSEYQKYNLEFRHNKLDIFTPYSVLDYFIVTLFKQNLLSYLRGVVLNRNTRRIIYQLLTLLQGRGS